MTESNTGAGTRAGFVAVIGAPNAGKSTLVNRLVGSKVSIVTQKVQTTRFPVRGVAMEGPSQIILVDTPGVFSPRRRLDRAMVRSAWTGAEEADAVVHLVDVRAELAVQDGGATGADRLGVEDSRTVIEGLKKAGIHAILAVNKIDGVKRERLLAVTKELYDSGAYNEAFMISAAKGDGVNHLKTRLAALMPEGPLLYPEDQLVDVPARLMASEITREKLYLRVHDELPYAAHVETTAYTMRKDGSARIEQTIFVERESQKGIVVGAGGQTLKWIGQASREELTEILGYPVHLFLHVQVRETWAEERGAFEGLGLDFDV
jgi:GTP-binding protein Era